MIRMGFWMVLGAYYTIVIVRNPQNSIGNYLGPCIMKSAPARPTYRAGIVKPSARSNPGSPEVPFTQFLVLGFRVYL